MTVLLTTRSLVLVGRVSTVVSMALVTLGGIIIISPFLPVRHSGLNFSSLYRFRIVGCIGTDFLLS